MADHELRAFLKFQKDNPTLDSEQLIAHFTAKTTGGSQIREIAPDMLRTGSEPGQSHYPRIAEKMTRTHSASFPSFPRPQAQGAVRTRQLSSQLSTDPNHISISQLLPFPVDDGSTYPHTIIPNGTTPEVVEYSNSYHERYPTVDQVVDDATSFLMDDGGICASQAASMHNLSVFSAQQMVRRPSNNTESDHYSTSPASFPMSPRSRSYSNASSFGLSVNTASSPMSRQTSGGSCLPGALDMLRVDSDPGMMFPPDDPVVIPDTAVDGTNGIDCSPAVASAPQGTNSGSPSNKRPSATTVEALDETYQKPAHTGRTRRAPKSPRTAVQKEQARQQHARPPTRKETAIAPAKAPSGPPNTSSIQISPARQQKKYIRPRHPRVKCHLCPPSHEGFRGDHEFRRHRDRAHAPSGVRRVWVTRDLSADGKLLSKCKACSTRRQYGIDYNATAHLKRQHFNTEKNPKLKVPENLRDWIQMIEVRGDEFVKKKRRGPKGQAVREEEDVLEQAEVDEEEVAQEKLGINFEVAELEGYINAQIPSTYGYEEKGDQIPRVVLPTEEQLGSHTFQQIDDGSQLTGELNYCMASSSGATPLTQDHYSHYNEHAYVMHQAMYPVQDVAAVHVPVHSNEDFSNSSFSFYDRIV